MIQAIPPAEDRGAIDITFAYQKGGQVINLVVPLSTLVPQPPSPEAEAPESSRRVAIHKSLGHGVFLVARRIQPRTTTLED